MGRNKRLGFRVRQGDGYTRTINKRGGGHFNNEVEIKFTYVKFYEGIEEVRRMAAQHVRELKAGDGIEFIRGAAFEDFEINGYWRKNIKWRVNNIAKETSAVMKEAMKRQIGGRIETGEMKRSVYGRTEVASAAQTSSRAGWLDLFYKYFGFQEEGTELISPMHSLNAAMLAGRLHAGKEINKMSRDYRRGMKGPIR